MKHEKIILVLVSYIIGLTTGYIAFAFNSDFSRDFVLVQVEPASTKGIVSTIESNEIGLFAMIGGKQQILSARVEENRTEEPGGHFDIPIVRESLNGKYVYFCEQYTVTADDCSGFVYVANDHTAHRVHVDGGTKSVSVNDSQVSWNQKGQLSVNGDISVEGGVPWRLSSE